jgi:hypothetical protein
MKNLFKGGSLKLMSFLLAIMLCFSVIPITFSSSVEATDDTDNNSNIAVVDNGITCTMTSNGKNYTGSEWTNYAVTVNAVINDYGNISSAFYKKSTDADTDDNWIEIKADEQNGSRLSTTDEAGGAELEFIIAAQNYNGTYDLKFKNAADTSSNDFIKKSQVFAVKMDIDAPVVSASVDAKDWTNKATISGTVTDDGSGVKSLEYSLGDNGSRNSVAVDSTDGSFSIEVNENFDGNVNLYAADNLDNEQLAACIPVKVDVATPTIEKVEADNTSWTKDSVKITGSFSDNLSGVKEVRYAYVTGETPEINGEKDAKATLKDSEFEFIINDKKDENFSGKIFVYAVDNANNNSFDSSKLTYVEVNIDTQECVITEISATPTEWTNGEIVINGTIKDNLSGVDEETVQYCVYPSNTSEKSWETVDKNNITNLKDENGIEFTITLNKEDKLESGEYNVEVSVSDKAGNGATLDETNNSSIIYPLTINIDNKAPVIDESSISVTSNTWTNGQVTIRGTVTDEHSGVQKVCYRKTNSSEPYKEAKLIDNSFCFEVEASDNDSYNGTYEIVAYDNANTDDYEKANSLTVTSPDVFLDKTNPTVDECNISTGDETQSVTISGTVSDTDSGVASVKYKKSNESNYQDVDNFDETSGVYSFEIKDTNYSGTFDVICIDKAGNQSEKSTSKTVKVDNTSPVITEVNPDITKYKDDWTKSDITFTIKANDQEDNNYESGVKEVKYYFSKGNDNKVIENNYPNGTAKYENDEYTFTISVENLPNGGFNGNVVVYAVDKAGNESEYNITAVKIDTKTNLISVSSVVDNGWTNQNVTVSGSVSDIYDEKNKDNISGIDEIKYKKSGEGENSWIKLTSKEMDLSDDGQTADFEFVIDKQDYSGNYDICYVDKAGNELSTTFNVKMDNTAPSLTIDNADMTEWTNGEVIFTGTFSDNLSGVENVQYRHVYNDGTNEDWQDVKFNTDNNGLSGDFSFTLPAQNFDGYIEIYCVDRAKNTDYGENAISKRKVLMDNTAPSLTINNADMTETEWTNGEVTFTGTFSDNLSGVENVQYRHVYNDGTYEDWQDVNFNTSNNGLSGDFSFTLPAQNFNGYIEIYCVDRAKNTDYGENAISKRKVLMDNTSPNLKVEISNPVNIWTNILKTITFGYYNYSNNNENVNLNIKLTASDPAPEEKYGKPSYIDYCEYYNKDTGEKIKLSSKNSSIKSENNIVTIEFTVAAPLNADLDFIVYDKAGNSSTNDKADNTFSENDTIEQYIVDNITPERTVTYSSPIRVVNSSLYDITFDSKSEDTTTTLYYDSNATLIFDVNEANFYSDDINNTGDSGLKNLPNCSLKVTKNGKDYTGYSMTSWSDDGDKHTATMTLIEEGTYVVTMNYQDRSMNKMATYTSATIVIDRTNPVLNVSYSNKDVKNTIDGRKYFDDIQTATITITEKNFRADDVVAKVTALNSSGGDVTVQNFASYLKDRSSWTSNGDVHTATISYPVDANYTFDIDYKDLANRKISDYTEDKFTVDKTSPEEISIDYSDSVLNKTINSVLFGFYDAPVTVKISCFDATSGVYNFDYEGIIASDASSINKAVVKTAIENASITTTGGTSTATFTIPQSALSAINSFNGTVTVNATDRSDNSTENADKTRIVADNIDPVGTLTFNTPSGSSGGVDYYSGDITASLEITEANFYAEDVNFTVNNSQVSLNWQTNGDVHTATYTVSAENEYTFALNYTDRSGNKMTEITKSNMIIDKTAPTITIDNSLKNLSANNDDTIKLQISVDDKYFDASCIDAKLQAVVSKTSEKNPELKASELKTEDVELGTPELNGTTYTYTISNVDLDGYYTLTCNAKDYAGNTNSDMSCKDSSDQDKDVESFSFSVNRDGSTFWVDSSVENDTYSNSDSILVSLHEINVDKVAQKSTLRVINDEETDTVTLDNSNYVENSKIGTAGWYETVYTLDNSYFEEDSNYTITVTSHDKAGNVNISSDSDLSVISFTVDRTAPIISSNVSDNQSIDADNFNVEFKVTERNIDSESLQVKLNDEVITADTLNSDSYTFKMGSDKLYQNIEITVSDLAGNTSEVYKVENITISTNPFVRWYANQLLFWLSIAGVVLVVGIVIFIIVFRRKRKASAIESE